jgi:polyribonucleotide nucleotidyltransferase
MYKVIETKIGDKNLIIETGKLAKQADGAVLIKFGDTQVLVTAVADKKEREGLDFFPLTVDFVEKFYASGKIPGGYLKREARPSDIATLTSRLIDRPIRPLFPEGFKSETQVIATVLSYDPNYGADQIGIIGASAALMISDIPFNGPIASCRVARVDGKLIAAPTTEELANSDLDMLVASSKDAVVMVEGASKEMPENEMLEAIMFAFDSVQPVIKAQEELAKALGKTKRIFSEPVKDETLTKLITDYCMKKLPEAFSIKEKLARYAAISEVKKALKEDIISKYPEEHKDNFEKIFEGKTAAFEFFCGTVFEDIKYNYARDLVLNKKQRIDGRSFTEVRPIACEVGLLPRVHGSSLFTRGETQVLAAVTLGSPDDEQFVDSLEGLTKDKFMLHYNFPPFSVGEAKGLRGPGRREIGHGTLAKRGISAVLPDYEKFPYTIRIVSEVLESNGSSSMGTVCSGCMALLNAGAPLKSTVAGVAMGLIAEKDNFVVLTDILGDEDHLGDMDFKVVGTKKGITAIQMDIKIAGVTKEIMNQALSQAKDGRLHIINEMEKTISEPGEFSDYTPRVETIQIAKEVIKDVIGSGGKVIKGIVEKTGAKINVNDSGVVTIMSSDKNSLELAKSIIKGIAFEPEPGTVFDAVVKKIMDFGAFVEYLPGKEGLVHVSEIDEKRVDKVTEYLNEGDTCKVMYLGSDKQGRVKLSIKAVKKQDK